MLDRNREKVRDDAAAKLNQFLQRCAAQFLMSDPFAPEADVRQPDTTYLAVLEKRLKAVKDKKNINSKSIIKDIESLKNDRLFEFLSGPEPAVKVDEKFDDDIDTQEEPIKSSLLRQKVAPQTNYDTYRQAEESPSEKQETRRRIPSSSVEQCSTSLVSSFVGPAGIWRLKFVDEKKLDWEEDCIFERSQYYDSILFYFIMKPRHVSCWERTRDAFYSTSCHRRRNSCGDRRNMGQSVRSRSTC
uniref:SPK domain-containing protein n=1 Tax=Caenorhabditis tropicalis TaxID=1561998 RepID=A0A1I7UBK4_9PELO